MLVPVVRRARRRAARAALAGILGVVLVLVAFPAPGASAAPDAAPDGGRFAGTARLPGCSGAVVRWPAALDTDRAVVLTNGHCVRRPYLGAREVLVDERRWTAIQLLDGDGRHTTQVRGVRLLYASMYRTDLALLEINRTYDQLAALGRTWLQLAGEGPARGDRVRIPSAWWTEQRACATTGTAHRLHERRWDWWDSIRLPARGGCAIRGGYSGSPLVSRDTGLVVGVVNTAWAGGRRCVDSACEEDRRGRVVTRRHVNYGQQTAWLLGCLDAGRTFDLDVPGCRLATPRR